MTNPEAAEKEEDATAGVMQVEAETDQKQEDAEADVMQVGTETDQKQVEATDEDAKEEDDEEEGSSYSSYSSQEKEVAKTWHELDCDLKEMELDHVSKVAARGRSQVEDKEAKYCRLSNDIIAIDTKRIEACQMKIRHLKNEMSN